MIKIICRWYWRRRVQALYSAYHADFTDNILEAQQRRNLPESTIRIRNKFNKALEKLRMVEPGTRWRPLA